MTAAKMGESTVADDELVPGDFSVAGERLSIVMVAPEMLAAVRDAWMCVFSDAIAPEFCSAVTAAVALAAEGMVRT